MGKTLVAYFSATGTTARVADRISDALGADAFDIVPAQPYSAADLNWNNPQSRSSIEMKDEQARPAIKSRVATFDDYTSVVIGFPIWWYQAPRIIETFLESYDFSGKTIAVFATSGGSDLGDTEALLKPHCAADARWLPGRVLNAGNAKAAAQWAQSLDLL